MVNLGGFTDMHSSWCEQVFDEWNIPFEGSPYALEVKNNACIKKGHCPY